MDSITHALFKAIAAENRRQIASAQPETTIGAAVPGDHDAGLQPLARRPQVHDTFAGARGTDLHISLLTRSEEVLALFMELCSSGFAPPVSLIEGEAEVIIGEGHIEVFAPFDDASASWVGILDKRVNNSKNGDRRSFWSEDKA